MRAQQTGGTTAIIIRNFRGTLMHLASFQLGAHPEFSWSADESKAMRVPRTAAPEILRAANAYDHAMPLPERAVAVDPKGNVIDAGAALVEQQEQQQQEGGVCPVSAAELREAQFDLDHHPANSPFWDTPRGQDSLGIAGELGLAPTTTPLFRRQWHSDGMRAMARALVCGEEA